VILYFLLFFKTLKNIYNYFFNFIEKKYIYFLFHSLFVNKKYKNKNDLKNLAAHEWQKAYKRAASLRADWRFLAGSRSRLPTWLEKMSANGKISSENNLRYIVKDFLFRFNNYDVIPLINLIIMMSLLPLCYSVA
jgi:hypothetical protein